jgi:hypothetical protein
MLAASERVSIAKLKMKKRLQWTTNGLGWERTLIKSCEEYYNFKLPLAAKKINICLAHTLALHKKCIKITVRNLQLRIAACADLI